MQDCPQRQGGPLPPSKQPWCGTCPAGWASAEVDAGHCQMCSPGSYAALPQSVSCEPCANGTYAYSWGSTHCNHCIIGTYAPHPVRLPSNYRLNQYPPKMFALS